MWNELHPQAEIDEDFFSDGGDADREIDFEQTYDQALAWQILHDLETRELLFGGGAGGGKSELGCAWAITMCLNYEGIRGLIARNTLKDLKDSTLLTFFDVCKKWGLEPDKDYTYYSDSHIVFHQTGSTIYLRELKWIPTDPNFDRLGSTEYTFAFIEEAQQIRQKAKNILRSRLRYKLQENGLKPKLLMTCNPSKGFLYTEFYKPAKENKLPTVKKFVIALASGNRFVDPSYIENLRTLDKETQERLLYGNWEYDDDPSTMIKYDALVDMFSNKVPVSEKGFIIADVARQGRDRTVISYWLGLRCVRIAAFTKLPLVPSPEDQLRIARGEKPLGKSVAGKLIEWRTQYNVPLSRVLADEDGMGGGVIDYLGCKGFMGGRRPFNGKNGKPENYPNVKTQCAYKLSDIVNASLLSIECDNPALRELILEECEQLKTEGQDKDGKRRIVAKDTIKDKIGRSPDFLDNLTMRMWYEFAPVPTVGWL